MRNAAADTRTGEFLNQKFELCELLESSEVHDTYRALDRTNAAEVKVRLLRPEFALQSSVVQGFVRAPKTVTGFKHPNVAQVFSVESDETGIPYVVEEYLHGETLARMLQKFSGGMPLGVAMAVVSPVLEAMAAAHKRGIIHGRLDTDHVLIAKVGSGSVPKVIAFGALGSEQHSVGSDARRLAPELRNGKAKPDLSSDVWSLGALLYVTLGGQQPETQRGVHVSLDELAPHLPSEIVELVERCLCALPRSRPKTADEVRDALVAACEHMRVGETKPLPAAAQVRQPEISRAAANTVPAEPPPIIRPARARKHDDEASFADVSEERAKPAVDSSYDEASFADVSEERAKPAVDSAHDEASFADVANEHPDPFAAKARGQVGFAHAATRSVRPPSRQKASLPVAKPAAPPRVLAAKPSVSSGPAIDSIAFGATVFAKAASAAVPPSSLAPMPLATDDAAELALMDTVAQDPDDDGPEITLSQAAPSIAPPVVKTMKDLRAAFRPVEGGSSIEQGETEDAARARAFRKAMDEASARRRRSVEPTDEKPTDEKPASTAPIPPLASRKQLREGLAPTPQRASEQSLRTIRESAKNDEGRVRRALGALLIFAFAFALIYVLPLLYDPTHQKAEALLGARTKLVMGSFSILTVVAMIRTWAVQISQKPPLLGPVNMMLKLVTVMVCVLCSGYFLPVGALGPMTVAARTALPWAAGGFYMFFGLYGLMGAVRGAGQGALQSVATAMVYITAFMGAYLSISTTVLKEMRERRIAASAVHGNSGSMVEQLKNLTAHSPDAPQPVLNEKVVERKMAGGDEASDMESINEIGNTQKRQAARFDNAKHAAEKLTR